MSRLFEVLTIAALGILIVGVAIWTGGEIERSCGGSASAPTPTINLPEPTKWLPTPTETVTPTPTETPIPTPPLTSVDVAGEDDVNWYRIRDGVAYEQIVTIRYKMVSYCLGLINGEWVLIEFAFG